MARRRPKPAADQLSFFDLPQKSSETTGSLDISLMVREVLADTLAAAKERSSGVLDRYRLAAEMSRLSGRDVTKHMLDRYTAPSAEDWRFPLEALPALVEATGDYRLLEEVAEVCGCRVLRGEETVLAEWGALELHERRIKARKAAIKASVPDEVVERLVREVLRRLG